MSAFGKLLRHLRHGTLLQRLRQRRGALPGHVRVRWHGTGDAGEAAAALATWGASCLAAAPPGGWLLCLGRDGPFRARLERVLTQRQLAWRAHALDEVRGWTAVPDGLRCILSADTDAADQHAAARALAAHPALAAVPFEYVAGLTPERAEFAELDEYRDTYFVSPVLLGQPSPYALYRESLQHFEQKCGLRDYLDLYQLLCHVVRNDVPGDVAEFGSYRGHSGWLIARTLQALGSDRRVHLFDTFAEFPAEPGGVDHFWKGTHAVDFAEVRRLLAPFPNVALVRGDFTATLAEARLGALALAYVDCDSYRATRFLYERLWRDHLAPGALLVCEDYGHPALLGSRVAVDEAGAARAGFRFFSQFSGLHVTLRTG